jgi:hypothetical protein
MSAIRCCRAWNLPADGLCAQGSNASVHRTFDDGEAMAVGADQGVGAERHVREPQIRGAAAGLRGVGEQRQTR